MAKYYWTTQHEVPPVYHSRQLCPVGKDIKEEHIETSDQVPEGRRLCERC
jgi:hypothetical protein